MKQTVSDRGFQFVTHPVYLPDSKANERLVSQSSAVGDYEDSWWCPGSSFLWIGEHHHLNREEVAELQQALKSWLETGRLF